MKLDTSRLPVGTHKMVRAYYELGYRLTRPDIPHALKLVLGTAVDRNVHRPPPPVVYVVSVNKKGKAGPFVGVAFLRA